MGSYNYTISIGHLGEQLTLNQWVLGSSPRWCTKKSLTENVRLFFYCYNPESRAGAPSGTRTARARRPLRRAKRVQWTLFRARESPREMGKRAEHAGGRDVPATQPYGRRRKQGAGAGAAVAEDKPRPKGRRPMRAPQLVRRHRSAGTNSPVDCWLARGRVPGEWERKQSVPGVEMLPLYNLTESVGLFFIAIIRNVATVCAPSEDENSREGGRRLRRKQGAVAGAARKNPMFAIISHL